LTLNSVSALDAWLDAEPLASVDSPPDPAAS
jgi:hypothetical protein